MGGQPAGISRDLAILRVLERHGGIASREQLLGIGLTGRMIERRLAKGVLRSVHRGVYALGTNPIARPGLQRAAWLAVGSASGVSHLDAAASWEMRPPPAGPVAITLPDGPGREKRRGIRLHRAPLAAGDWLWRGGLRVTSPARTLIDIAPLLPTRDLALALDEAHYRNQVSAFSLAEALERNAGRTGTRALRHLLAHHELGTTRTETTLEELFVTSYQRWGRFRFETQVRIPPFRVDLFFAAHRCAVEVDGPIHRLESRRHADAERDRALERRGIRTIRVPDTELEADPRATVDRVDRDIAVG